MKREKKNTFFKPYTNENADALFLKKKTTKNLGMLKAFSTIFSPNANKAIVIF
jgi:hypothetical protein